MGEVSRAIGAAHDAESNAIKCVALNHRPFDGVGAIRRFGIGGKIILGAEALGDIGKFYPDTDMKWKDMNSMTILRDVAEKYRQLKAKINNIDAAIVAQAPKISPHIPKMQEIMAANLGITPSQIGIKATTSEAMGFTGRKEGIVAIAMASIEL